MQFERVLTIVAISVFGVLALRFLTTKLAGRLIEASHRWFPDTDSQLASFQRRLDNIRKLSDNEARARALAVLSDENRFVCSALTDEQIVSPPITLGPAASELFSRYSSIETAGGEMLIGPNVIRNVSTKTYHEIGGTEDGAVYVTQSSDVIYEMSADRRELAPVADTVYHWLLMVDLMFHDDESFRPHDNEDLPSDGDSKT